MSLNFERAFTRDAQFEMAAKVISATMAMIGEGASAEFQARALEQARQAELSPERRGLAAALQARGVALASEPLRAIFDSPEDAKRFDALQQALESASIPAALALLLSDELAGADFKKAMCCNVVIRIAELLAREMERAKRGPTFLINKGMQELADNIAAAQRVKETEALIVFLVSIPERYPSFGAQAFNWSRTEVLTRISEAYKSAGIHDAIAKMFEDALDRMQPESRQRIGHAAA